MARSATMKNKEGDTLPEGEAVQEQLPGMENVEGQEKEIDEPVEDSHQVDEEEEWDSRAQDPDEELWEGGPNWAQINEWKDMYGKVFIAAVTHDTYVVYRTLNRFEYRKLMKHMEDAISSGVDRTQANFNNEEAIAETCILSPRYDRANPAGQLAGLASAIANEVLEASAFVPLEVRQL